MHSVACLKGRKSKEIVIIYESPTAFFCRAAFHKTVWLGAHIAVLQSRLPAARPPACSLALWRTSSFLHESLTLALNHHPPHVLSDVSAKHALLAKAEYLCGRAARLPEATLTVVAQRPRGKEKFDVWVNLPN